MGQLLQKIKKSDEKYKVFNSQSTGTENYHVFNPFTRQNLLATDGVMELFKEKNCYWFGDVVASYFPNFKKMGIEFALVRIVKNLTGDGCIFLVQGDSDEEKPLIQQEIGYTDLDCNLKTYLIFDGERYFLIMPSEY